uniref:Uncharacterized protein n=1 Tax=Glossina austeni TaxID=7395 RepID=A0A1A9VHA6_GLOAU
MFLFFTSFQIIDTLNIELSMRQMCSLGLITIFIGNIVDLIFVSLFVDKGETAMHNEGIVVFVKILQLSFGIVLSTIGGFETEFVTIGTNIRFVTKNLSMIIMIMMLVMFVMLGSSQSSGEKSSKDNDEFHFSYVFQVGQNVSVPRRKIGIKNSVEIEKKNFIPPMPTI